MLFDCCVHNRVIWAGWHEGRWSDHFRMQHLLCLTVPWINLCTQTLPSRPNLGTTSLWWRGKSDEERLHAWNKDIQLLLLFYSETDDFLILLPQCNVCFIFCWMFNNNEIKWSWWGILSALSLLNVHYITLTSQPEENFLHSHNSLDFLFQLRNGIDIDLIRPMWREGVVLNYSGILFFWNSTNVTDHFNNCKTKTPNV